MKLFNRPFGFGRVEKLLDGCWIRPATPNKNEKYKILLDDLGVDFAEKLSLA